MIISVAMFLSHAVHFSSRPLLAIFKQEGAEGRSWVHPAFGGVFGEIARELLVPVGDGRTPALQAMVGSPNVTSSAFGGVGTSVPRLRRGRVSQWLLRRRRGKCCFAWRWVLRCVAEGLLTISAGSGLRPH